MALIHVASLFPKAFPSPTPLIFFFYKDHDILKYIIILFYHFA